MAINVTPISFKTLLTDVSASANNTSVNEILFPGNKTNLNILPKCALISNPGSIGNINNNNSIE